MAPIIEASPDRIRHLGQLQRQYRQQLPARFAMTWRCDVADCDGQPHEGHPEDHARSAQIIPDNTKVFYLVGGRGSGKTWAGAANFAQLILDTPPDHGDDHTEWAIVAPTLDDARAICVEGPSGLLKALGHRTERSMVDRWLRGESKLYLTTGALIYLDSAVEGGPRIQGKNLYGAWCDEVGLWRKWRLAWEESLGFAVRKGPSRIFCTGTPKRSSLAKLLLDDPSVGRRRLRTIDNIGHLSPEFVSKQVDRYKGTALGQQELEGLLLSDVDGAIWRRDLIDALRVDAHTPAFWQRKVLALDPSDGSETSDEQGMALVGHSPEDQHLYVLHSDGDRLTPWDWLTKAVRFAAAEHAEVLVEKNHGGEYLTGLLEQVMQALNVRVPYSTVDAGQSKRTRAEQVAGLYEQRRVHHVGVFPDLEDQMCSWLGTGREPSPDRMDALVWALSPFQTLQLNPDPATDTVVRWDIQKEAETWGRAQGGW